MGKFRCGQGQASLDTQGEIPSSPPSCWDCLTPVSAFGVIFLPCGGGGLSTLFFLVKLSVTALGELCLMILGSLLSQHS